MEHKIRRTLFLLPILSAILFVISTVCILISYSNTENIVKKDCYDRLEETAVSTARHFDDVLIGNETMLKGLADLMSTEEDFLSENSIMYMTQFNDMFNATRLRLLLPDDTLHNPDGSQIDLYETISYADLLATETDFSHRTVSKQYNGQMIIRQYCPILREGRPVAILYLTYVCDDIPEIVDIDSYNGNSDIYVIDRRNGDFIADSYEYHDTLSNIYTLKAESGIGSENYDEMIEEVKSGLTGNSVIRPLYGKDNLFIAYAPSKFEQWEVVVSVSEDVAMAPMIKYRSIAISLALIQFICFAVYTFWVVNRYNVLKFLYSHDALTGALNRYGLNETFMEIKNNSIGVMILDIDHFKEINDTYGHYNGDVILKGLVEVIKDTVKNDAIIHRWGGEEFAVVFKNGAVALDSAVHLMNIIRAKEFILNGHEVHVTTSAGLVVSSESDEFKSFDKLMLKADDRLYRAKEEGRDRLVFKD